MAQRGWHIVGFILPLMIILVCLVIVPLGYSLWLAFHNWTLATRASPSFIGLTNFSRLFQDARFGNALFNMAIFMSTAVSVEFLLGFTIALVLSRSKLKGVRFIRTFITMPMMIASLIVGYFFRLLFHPSVGPINHIFGLLGLSRVEWLGSSRISLLSVIIVDIWQWTPFMTLILLSGIQSLPQDVYEAAKADGASHWQSFRYLTLPLLSSVIMVCCMLRIIDVFRMFDVNFILTGGGPGVSSELISLYVYKTAFSFFKMGYAAAMSYILLVIVVVIVSQFFGKFIRR